MSIDEIKSEIENLTSKSLSELIAFAIHVRDQRDPAAVAAMKSRTDDTDPNHLLWPDEFEKRPEGQ